MGKKKNLATLSQEDIDFINGKMNPRNNEEQNPLYYANMSSALDYKINLKCKNEKQKELVNSIKNNKITIVEGLFGVGKSYVIASVALKMLKELDNGINKIICIAPTVEVGEMHMGLMPGDMEDKISYHIINEIDCMKKVLKDNGNLGSGQIIDTLMKREIIEFRPISYLRGASFRDSLILVSEAEEFTKEELFLIISRYESGKMVISGDPLQSSRKSIKQGNSGLLHASERLQGIKDVGVVKFSEKDIVRNDILLEIFKKWKN